MSSGFVRLRRVLASILTGTLVVLGADLALAPVAEAATDPQYNVVDRAPDAVTADALPTVQIDNGVVWDQAVVGDTVYVGGEFENARPAGAAPGTNLVPRKNILAYNVRTGALISTFAPRLNGKVSAMALSPDKSRLYVGGVFTTVNETTTRNRLLAFNTADGSLVSTFAPNISNQVTAITATTKAVYFGGTYGSVNGQPRLRLAAVSPVNGSLLAWAPSADGSVRALTQSPDGSRIIVGGQFPNMNGSFVAGLASLDANSATLYPFAANTVIKNYGDTAGIHSLKSDGTNIYGTGFWFGGTGNWEGPFSADPYTGAIKWLGDCHGDTYDTAVVNDTVYSVSHHHSCLNIGGFPDTSPRSRWLRGNAFTRAATSTVKKNVTSPYANFGGQPAPSLVNWFPDLPIGTYTGQSQGPWTAESTSQYLLLGGEFPSVNGTRQQGLVRFAVPSLAPKKLGPRISAAESAPALRALSGNAVRVSWTSNWDRDDQTLTYKVYRVGSPDKLITTRTLTSQFWNRPVQAVLDSGLTPNSSYSYYVTVSDPDGNSLKSATTAVTTGSGTSEENAYTSAVQNDGASHYWRLNESSGSTSTDWAGGNNLVLGAGASLGAPGAITGSKDTAATFNGTLTGTAGQTTTESGSTAFTAEAWVKTTTLLGGKIAGFGNSQTGTSTSYDRHLYMTNAGRIVFGVYPGAVKSVQTSAAYNDGQWHHVVGTLSGSGMRLYLDGALQASDASVTTAQSYAGYWRVGGDNLSGWPNRPTSNWLSGTIDDVSIYPSGLSAAQVSNHYATGRAVNQKPTAAFTLAATGLQVSVDGSPSTDSDGTVASYAWDYGDGGTGTGVTATHTYAAEGTYTVRLTVTDDKGATGTTTQSVTVTRPPNQMPTAQFTTSTDELVLSVDGSGSADSDGSIVSHAWDYGDGSTGSGVKDTHTYASAGTYTVKLTVTDDRGGTDSSTKSVTVSLNQSPNASFTSSVSALKVSVDGSASSDPDGTVASYAWDYGDGSTGSGVTDSHTYAAGGTYDVKLTVTDNKGATDPTTKSVTVVAADANTMAKDGFERTGLRWGTADTGGAWTDAGSTYFSTSGGKGLIKLTRAGVGPSASLGDVSVLDSTTSLQVSFDKPATGTGTYVNLASRRTANNEVRLGLRLMSDNTVRLTTSTLVNGASTTLKEVLVPGMTYQAGEVLNLRFDVSGSGTTTVAGKVWKASDPEPASAQVTGTTSAASLQTAGSVSIQGYLAGSATNAPVVISVDDYLVMRT